MGPEVLDGLPLSDARIVHVSGITPALSPTCSALVEAVIDSATGAGTTVSFDVNYRAALWGAGAASSVLRSFAQRAGVVFVGMDEADTLWGTKTPDEVRALLDGPRVLVVKDGHIGATEFSATGTVFVPAIHTDVVEAVGAGDAFAGGYLDASLSGADAEARLRSGHERAVMVLQSTGDFLPARSVRTTGTER